MWRNVCQPIAPILAGVLYARVMQKHTNAVTGFLILVTPDTRCCPARRTFHHTATRGAKVPLLDLGGIVGPVRSGIGKDPAFFRGHSLRAPLQNV